MKIILKTLVLFLKNSESSVLSQSTLTLCDKYSNSAKSSCKDKLVLLVNVNSGQVSFLWKANYNLRREKLKIWNLYLRT